MSTEKERRALEAGQRVIVDYLKQMGINPALLAAAHGIGRNNVHFLTRDEFLERRRMGEFIESAEVHGEDWYLARSHGAGRSQQRSIAAKHDDSLSGIDQLLALDHSARPE